MKQFTWTDELAKEFCEYVGLRVGKNIDIRQQINLMTEDFKKSKEPKPEWEILSFFDYMGQPLEFIDGKFRNETNSLGLQNCLNMGYRIRSVKRISDNEVFTVKDNVQSTWGMQTIVGFIINDNNGLVVEFETCRNPLDKISKAPERKVLFTTEDGVDYHGEEIQMWHVKPNEWDVIEVYAPNYWSVEHICHTKTEAAHIGKITTDNKWFSKKDNAERYVLMSAPLEVSLNEILKVVRTVTDSAMGYNNKNYLNQEFQKLAKEKLKL